MDQIRTETFMTRHGGLWPLSSSSQPASPFLSVVAPCYNEQHGVQQFVERVLAVCESVGKEFEIILVDDGSTDQTWVMIQNLCGGHPGVSGIRLSRNFGQESAIAAALSATRGELILILDADLQDPPELLPRMLDMLRDDVDVVYGQRRSRAGESWCKRLTAYVFYRLMRRLTKCPIPPDTGVFRLMRRRVVEAVLQMPESTRYTRGIMAWVGFRQIPFAFDREARQAGVSHWPWGHMLRLAADAICGFSLKPLRFAGFASLVALLVAIFLFARFLQVWMLGETLWNLLFLSVVTILASLQMFGLFVIGEYIGRQSVEVRQRPLYIVECVIRSCDQATQFEGHN